MSYAEQSTESERTQAELKRLKELVDRAAAIMKTALAFPEKPWVEDFFREWLEKYDAA